MTSNQKSQIFEDLKHQTNRVSYIKVQPESSSARRTVSYKTLKNME